VKRRGVEGSRHLVERRARARIDADHAPHAIDQLQVGLIGWRAGLASAGARDGCSRWLSFCR
jgi:hypothetical protein